MKISIPKNFFGEDIPLTVFISQEQLHERKIGDLYGRYFDDTGIFNVYPEQLKNKGVLLGKVLPEGSTPNQDEFCGIVNDTGITFFWDGKEINTESYELYQNIFSRNKGILETDVMNKKCLPM